MAVLLQTFSYSLIHQQGKVLEQREIVDALAGQTQTVSIAAQLSDAYLKLQSLSDTYYDYLIVLVFLYILTFGYLLQDIQEMVYLHLNKVLVNTFDPFIMINLCSSITVIVWLFKQFGDYNSDMGQFREEIRASESIKRMEDDGAFNIRVTLALLIALHYIRLVLAMQVSRIFGPMVKIMQSLMVNILIFLFLYAAIFFIFAGVGQMLFQEIDEFKDMIETCKTLFASSFGNFEYVSYDPLKDVDPYVGYIYITVFLVVVGILLLNFLIAILSSTYSGLNKVKNGLYMRRIIQMRQRYQYDKYYSSIVFAPTPFNLLLLPVLPFVVFLKSKRLNNVVMVCEYI